jgi:hypothetical protein
MKSLSATPKPVGRILQFARLFPKGFAGDDVLREIAPDGWDKSPLLATFHPSLDQVYEEALRSHENLDSLQRRGKKRPAKPAPTREEVARLSPDAHRDRPRGGHRLVPRRRRFHRRLPQSADRRAAL